MKTRAPRLRADLMVNNLVGYAHLTGQVLIGSDGTPWRPLVHVEDIAAAFLAVLHAPREVVHNRSFNVARTDQNFRVREVADMVREVVPGSTITYAEGGGPDMPCPHLRDKTCHVKSGLLIAREPAAVAVITRITPPRRAVELHVGDLWAYRELLYFFVWRDLKVRYQQTFIGVGWVVVQPALTTIAFSLLFGRLAGLPSDDLPYPIFYLAGLLPWMYFSQSVTRATNTLVDNQSVITKVYFPRILLPVAAVLNGLIDLAIGCVVLGVLVPFYGLAPTAWTVPVFIALAVVAALAVGLWLSALHALYRDVRYAVQFLLTLWMFVSPVAYASSLVPERWRWLYTLNPMAGAIDGVRWALGGQHVPDPTLLAASAVAVVGLLIGGVVYFQRVDETVADVV